MKLNLGCGQNKLDGYINVDMYSSCEPDIVCNLEEFPWPFESNSATEIVLNHVLEHLGATPGIFLSIMKELYRVCAPDAEIHITVPHPRNDSFLGDPTHVRAITPRMMALFSKRKNREWKEEGYANSPLGLYLDIDFEVSDVRFYLEQPWKDQLKNDEITRAQADWAVRSHFNVVEEIKFVLTARK